MDGVFKCPDYTSLMMLLQAVFIRISIEYLFEVPSMEYHTVLWAIPMADYGIESFPFRATCIFSFRWEAKFVI